MQVVTPENFQTLVETGKVPEFVPPKADPKVEVTVEKTETKTDERPRGEDGKFLKADDTPEAAAVDDDDEGADLTGPVKAKIDKIVGKKHRQMKEAEEFAREMRADREAERERADRAEAALKAFQGEKSRPASVEDAKAPKAEDFKTVGEYAEALAEYKVEKKFAEREAKRDQEQREQAMQAAQAAHMKRIEATAKEIPDYAEVVAASDIDLPPHLAVYIAESPMGPKLGYHFAKHPDEYDRISKLSPIRAIAELGKLEDRLEKPKDPPPEKVADTTERTVSRAPSPITPLNASTTVVTKDPAKMSVQELREHERLQKVARAARR
jgi:hypothetical protein